MMKNNIFLYSTQRRPTEMDLARQRLADMMEEAKNRRAKLEQDTTQNPEDLTDNTENQLNEETTIKKGVRLDNMMPSIGSIHKGCHVM